MLWKGYELGMCVKEKEEGGVTGLVPFLTSLLDRKRLLLGVHVVQQVGNTVAVAILIVIPREREREAESEWVSNWGLCWGHCTGKKRTENQPRNQLDKVVIEGDAGARIENGGVGVTDEVRGHHL